MIDWDRILELTAEVGEDGITEIIEIFLEEMDEALEELAALSDASQIADKLHFLKGSAQNIGLTDTGRLCERLEADAKSGDAPPTDVAAIRNSIDKAKQELASL